MLSLHSMHGTRLLYRTTKNGAFIQKATGNGNATETVVPLSEQKELDVFVHTEETRRKRQRN